MRLAVIAFGKLKTPGLREACEHYKAHLKPWAALEEIELKPIPVPDKSPATRKKIQEKESLLLFEKLESRFMGGRGAFYLLDERGKALETLKWSELVQSWESSGSTDIALCIGSSLGFSSEVRARAKGMLSLGPQTLPHELARVVLCEQLFRAYSVIRGHPYHNEGSG